MPLRHEDLPDDVESLKALLLAAHRITSQHQLLSAQNQRLAAEHHFLTEKTATLEGEVARLTARAERLDHIVSVL